MKHRSITSIIYIQCINQSINFDIITYNFMYYVMKYKNVDEEHNH